ncbi:MAG: DUF2437 domain-containing protein, partial [Longimicrobiales bacterium]|nr:DUF2437 domain-containing protein [Longimicrobiales bacterium]
MAAAHAPGAPALLTLTVPALPTLTVLALLTLTVPALQAQGRVGGGEVVRVLRYEFQGRQEYGVLERGVVRELPGSDLFSAAVSAPTGRSHPLQEVRPLAPLEPELVEKVVAVVQNTRRPGRTTPAAHPRWYALFPTTLNRHEGEVTLPAEARAVSFAGGLVVIIGREGRNIPPEA